MSRTQTHTEDMRKTFEKLKASVVDDVTADILNVIQHLLEEIAELKQKLHECQGQDRKEKIHKRWNPEVRKGYNVKMHIVSEGASEDIVKENVQVKYGNSYGSHRFKPRNEKKLKPCQFCGETHIWGSENCRAFGQICRKCYKRNHFADVCRNKQLKPCKYCGKTHKWGSENCPEFGKTCENCGKLNHNSEICWSKTCVKKIEVVEAENKGTEMKDLAVANKGEDCDVAYIKEGRHYKGAAVVKVESGIERKAEEAPDTGSRNEDDTEESDVESNFKINRKTFDAKYPCMLKYCPIWFHNEFGQEYMDKWLEQKKEEIETEEEAIFYQQEVENMIKNLTPYDPESEQYMIIVGMLQEGKLSMQEIKEQLNEAEEERK
jgi:hypothetical protein